jgi:CBS domain-containing protein
MLETNREQRPMAQKIRDIMTTQPVCVPSSASVFDAARLMHDKNIGDVIVEDGGKVVGIVTDRDIVVRAVAERQNVEQTPIADVCSTELAVVHPDDDIDSVIKLMHSKAIRRVPVIENGKPVGIVSLGDLAVIRDRKSVLGGISAAAPNR